MNKPSDEELEVQEQLKQEQLRDDLSFLMDNPQFKRAILNTFISETALDIGTSFDNSQGAIDALKAVSYLRMFISTNH